MSDRTTGRRALVVDDAPEFLAMVAPPLHKEGFEVTTAAAGAEAVERARATDPDLIVLDLNLPDLDGVEVCRQVRAFSDAYIIMLTARTEEVDLLVGLAVGADDYMTKPFSPRELVARVRTLLRRPRQAPVAETARRIGELTVDDTAREVTLRGEVVELTKIEFDLLSTLANHPRMSFTRALLIERVWGLDFYGDDHLVDVHIANLRRKLDDDPRTGRYVKTVRGVGYRLGEG
jgi:DNA-binding response OmpR family regulator